jgi:hypothetical protein
VLTRPGQPSSPARRREDGEAARARMGCAAARLNSPPLLPSEEAEAGARLTDPGGCGRGAQLPEEVTDGLGGTTARARRPALVWSRAGVVAGIARGGRGRRDYQRQRQTVAFPAVVMGLGHGRSASRHCATISWRCSPWDATAWLLERGEVPSVGNGENLGSRPPVSWEAAPSSCGGQRHEGCGLWAKMCRRWRNLSWRR